MNRRPPRLIASTALVGFLQLKTAEALSKRTLASDQHHLEIWIAYAHDPFGG